MAIFGFRQAGLQFAEAGLLAGIFIARAVQLMFERGGRSSCLAFFLLEFFDLAAVKKVMYLE